MFINQSTKGLFEELVEDVVNTECPAYLVTGSLVQLNSEHLVTKIGVAYDRTSYFSRFQTWVHFLAYSARQIWTVPRNVLLIVVSNPPFLPWLACLANIFRKQQYLILVYDIYPEILVGLRRFKCTNPIILIWQNINRIVYDRALKIVTIGKYMGHSIAKYLPPKKMSIDIIPTWVDTKIFNPILKAQNHFATDNKIHDKFVVLYSGNIGFSHDISGLIDAALGLKQILDVEFLIIGDGPGKSALVDYAKILNVNNVRFFPYQEENVLKYSLATADVSIISIGSGAERFMMPSKTYYAMAVGSALLGISSPPNDLVEVIESCECGINVVPGDISSLIRAIHRFYSDRIYLNTCKTNARKAAEKYYSRKTNTNLFAEVISSCLSPIGNFVE